MMPSRYGPEAERRLREFQSRPILKDLRSLGRHAAGFLLAILAAFAVVGLMNALAEYEEFPPGTKAQIVQVGFGFATRNDAIEWRRLRSIGDSYGNTEFLVDGRAALLGGPTPILVIDRAFHDWRRIRILSGQYSGRAFWVRVGMLKTNGLVDR
jgi:hypothetical protein